MANNVFDKEANIRTIRMFIKLFVINIVANNFLGFSNNFTIIFSSFPLLESSFKSVFESEKNATSVPETRAELINKTKRIIVLNVVNISTDAKSKNKISGSGSNCYSFD